MIEGGRKSAIPSILVEYASSKMKWRACNLAHVTHSASISSCEQPYEFSIIPKFVHHCTKTPNIYICSGAKRLLANDLLLKFWSSIFEFRILWKNLTCKKRWFRFLIKRSDNKLEQGFVNREMRASAALGSHMQPVWYKINVFFCI